MRKNKISPQIFIVRVPDDDFRIEPRVKVQCLPLRFAHRESDDEGPIHVAERNGRDDHDVARGEGFRDVVAERVVRVGELNWRIRGGEDLPVVDLVDVLDVLGHLQAADLVDGEAELEGAIRNFVHGNMEAVVAD